MAEGTDPSPPAKKSRLGRFEGWRKESGERAEEERQGAALTVVSAALAFPALLALGIYALPGEGKVLSVGLLTAAAAFAAGALIGFLFGIPRTRVGVTTTPEDGAPTSLYEPNTNLEQISDWLTKILVGVGLVQIGQLGDAVNGLADGLEEGLGTYGHEVAVLLLVSFAVAGFMSSYLYTRLRLQRDFEPFKQALKDQEDSLTAALPLVRAQLDPSGERDPSAAELEAALYKASSGIRDEAFYLARNQRRSNWRGLDGEEKGLVELVIPVFDALVRLDKEAEWHRNYAELAYAEKDRVGARPRDFERARANLAKAIAIRDRDGSSDASRYPMYEFNRAYCNIKLDPSFVLERPASESLAEEIFADLEAAVATPTGLRAIRGDKGDRTVKRWLKCNRQDPRAQALRARAWNK